MLCARRAFPGRIAGRPASRGRVVRPDHRCDECGVRSATAVVEIGRRPGGSLCGRRRRMGSCWSIERQVLAGQLKAGGRLPAERESAPALGVSWPALREAAARSGFEEDLAEAEDLLARILPGVVRWRGSGARRHQHPKGA